MIRIFEYDTPTNFRDFENYVFTNLNSSLVDIPNDGVIIDAVKYRLSTAKLLTDDNSGTSMEYIRDGFSLTFNKNVNVTTVEDALDYIFDFKSISPKIALIANPEIFILRERGNDVVNPKISGIAKLGQNPQGTLTKMEFLRGTTVLHSENNPSPSTGYSHIDNNTVINNQSYSVRITDSEGRANMATSSYNFVYPFYVGWIDEPSEISNGMARNDILAISGMNLLIEEKGNKNVVRSPVNGRFCFMYPAAYGNLIKIIDNTGFDTIADYDVFDYNIEGLDGTLQAYKVYILKNDTTQTFFNNLYKFN